MSPRLTRLATRAGATLAAAATLGAGAALGLAPAAGAAPEDSQEQAQAPACSLAINGIARAEATLDLSKLPEGEGKPKVIWQVSEGLGYVDGKDEPAAFHLAGAESGGAVGARGIVVPVAGGLRLAAVDGNHLAETTALRLQLAPDDEGAWRGLVVADYLARTTGFGGGENYQLDNQVIATVALAEPGAVDVSAGRVELAGSATLTAAGAHFAGAGREGLELGEFSGTLECGETPSGAQADPGALFGGEPSAQRPEEPAAPGKPGEDEKPRPSDPPSENPNTTPTKPTNPPTDGGGDGGNGGNEQKPGNKPPKANEPQPPRPPQHRGGGGNHGGAPAPQAPAPQPAPQAAPPAAQAVPAPVAPRAPEVASGSAPRPAAALRPLPAAGPQRASELKTDDDSSDGGGGDEEVALSENVCEADDAQGVEESQAHWGVKQSFQSYITGSIAQGQWQLADVEHSDGEYHFSGANGAVSPDGKIGTVAYKGALHFTGHNGILDLLIEDPEIQWEGNEGHLIAVVVSNTIEGEPIDYGRTSVGRLEFEELDAGSGKASGRARLFLSESGSQAFAEFYEPGLELDPVSFEADLGGKPNCTDVQGKATSGGAKGELGGKAADKAAELRKDFDPSQTTGAENDSDSTFTVHDAKPAGLAGFADPNTPLVVTAAFLIAGGAMTVFVLRHPNS